MTTDPTEFIKFSHEIQDNLLNSGEIAFRTIINRTYYGLIHKLKIYFETNQNVIIAEPNRIHQEIINYTSNIFGSKYRKNLERLRHYRIQADYFLDISLTASDANYVLQKVEHFISELNL